MEPNHGRVVRSRPLAIAVGVFVGAALAGCSDATPRADQAAAGDASAARGQAVSAAGGSLVAFRLSRAARSRAEVSQSGAALAAVLYGRAIPAESLTSALAMASAGPDVLDVDIGSPQGLQLSYRGNNDRRLVINEAVTTSRAATDIGPDAARKVFLSAFQSAVGSRAVSATGMNPDGARTSRIVQGEGVSGQAPVERTSEYIFTVPRTINGIEVFDAGFEVSVHRTGQLARVQAFGPTVVSTLTAAGAEAPDASGYAFTRTVSQADLDARVAAEHPDAKIRPVGVAYWLPPGVVSAVVEPAQMYFVAPTATIEGEVVKARGFYVAYSLKDAALAPTVWPLAAHNPSGDGRK
jgi:hypothetical protein